MGDCSRGTVSRDYDGYTVCQRPKLLEPSEVVEHFRLLFANARDRYQRKSREMMTGS